MVLMIFFSYGIAMGREPENMHIVSVFYQDPDIGWRSIVYESDQPITRSDLVEFIDFEIDNITVEQLENGQLIPPHAPQILGSMPLNILLSGPADEVIIGGPAIGEVYEADFVPGPGVAGLYGNGIGVRSPGDEPMVDEDMDESEGLSEDYDGDEEDSSSGDL